jgi:sirohydrochlorin cobaltochelatase
MLILLAHGSRDAAWRGSLERLTSSVAESLEDHQEVRLAFMQFDGPTLPEVVAEAVEGGAEHLRLMPLFMATAGHVDKDIKPLVAELAQVYPDVQLEIMTPVGEDPLFPGFLSDIVGRL